MSLAYKTIKQLQLDIASRMSISFGSASGSGSAINYNDYDRIQQTLLMRFKMLFEEYYWENLATRATLTKAANTSGVVTDLATTIGRIEDVVYIFADDTREPLKPLPKRYNPLEFKGSRIRFFQTDAVHKILVVPYEATGILSVLYKVWPLSTVYNENDVMTLDSELLILGTVADLLEDDGDNPNQAAKYRNQYNARLRMLQNNQELQEVPLNTYTHHSNKDAYGEYDGQGNYSSQW